jgi:hypothetical protein
MGILSWLFGGGSPKLDYEKLYIVRGHEDWIKSGLIPYRNPEGAYYFRRIVRIKYNSIWHKGKFKLWKKWDKKDADKFLVVETKSGRKMLIPKEMVYFKQYNQRFQPVQGNDYCEIYKVHMYIEGDISKYERAYKKK